MGVGKNKDTWCQHPITITKARVSIHREEPSSTIKTQDSVQSEAWQKQKTAPGICTHSKPESQFLWGKVFPEAPCFREDTNSHECYLELNICQENNQLRVCDLCSASCRNQWVTYKNSIWSISTVLTAFLQQARFEIKDTVGISF